MSKMKQNKGRGQHRKNCLLAFIEKSLSDPSLHQLIRWSHEPTGMFQVLWIHAGRSNYHRKTQGCLFDLYREYRGRGMTTDPKQAFRMALKKSPCVIAVSNPDSQEDWKMFQIIRKCHHDQECLTSTTEDVWLNKNDQGPKQDLKTGESLLPVLKSPRKQDFSLEEKYILIDENSLNGKHSLTSNFFNSTPPNQTENYIQDYLKLSYMTKPYPEPSNHQMKYLPTSTQHAKLTGPNTYFPCNQNDPPGSLGSSKPSDSSTLSGNNAFVNVQQYSSAFAPMSEGLCQTEGNPKSFKGDPSSLINTLPLITNTSSAFTNKPMQNILAYENPFTPNQTNDKIYQLASSTASTFTSYPMSNCNQCLMESNFGNTRFSSLTESQAIDECDREIDYLRCYATLTGEPIPCNKTTSLVPKKNYYNCCTYGQNCGYQSSCPGQDFVSMYNPKCSGTMTSNSVGRSLSL